MRPRINSFGKITRKELDSYFVENQVYGITVKVDGNLLTYRYLMMFRNLNKEPEMINVMVSRTTKLVIKAWSETGRVFKNVEELKGYTKR